MLPLAVDPNEDLEVVRQVLRDRRFNCLPFERAPGIVRLLKDDSAVRIDQSKSAKRLIWPTRISAVDVNPRVHVLITALHPGDVRTPLPGELLAEADDELVDGRLVHV